jgi:ribose transport system permease protein
MDNVLTLLERFGLLALLGIVLVAFSIALPNTFGQSSNFQNIASSQSVLAVAALALLLPLVGGRFDVSVGGNMSMCAVLVATLMGPDGWSPTVSILLALVFGAFVGAINGVVVAYLGVNSIIATIGSGTIMSGVVQAYTHGIPISNGIPRSVTALGADTVLGIPDIFLVMLGIALAVWCVLTQSAYGRRLVATGSNLTAARLVGLDVRRTVMLSFIGAGLLAGATGVMQVITQGSGDPNAGGITFILPALAAVFLGSTNWRPGYYSVQGTVIGLYFIGATVTGLVLEGVQPWVTDVFDGAAIVIAVVLSAQVRRRRTGASEVGS